MDEREYELEYFKENEFRRKKCKKCSSYFWTRQNDKDRNTCGDAPCETYSFIGSPIFKEQSLDEMRELFLSFFEERSHTRLKRYPVVARWRDDIYLNIASIANFQPFVTSGKVPPPANPLVISQPCIRLEDLESIGKTGRHLTAFEMMGHHAFNRRGAAEKWEKEIYWKNETVRYCDEFLNKLGIEMESVTYKEAPWVGGGNAGPCLEVITCGLELATLVFMDLEHIPRGRGRGDAGDIEIKGERYRRMDTYIVDTGYGLERFVWASKGTPTIYDAIFPEVIKELVDAAGIEHPLEKHPEIEAIYAIADHTKCLAFMLADGIVPSNAREGYLARLILRRTFRMLKSVGIERPLEDIVLLQIKTLENSFPELGIYIDRIVEIISLEKQRYGETLLKGERIIRQLVKEYYKEEREEKKVSLEKLITLYDTHGLPPEFVKEVVSEIKTANLKAGSKVEVEVDVPENFYTLVARMHSADRKYAVGLEQELEQELEPFVESMEEKIKGIPETVKLYYEEPEAVDFEATVLASIDDFIVLDRTLFFPEGGGQPADTGFLTLTLVPEGECECESESSEVRVKEEVKVKIADVQEIDGVILHRIEDGVGNRNWNQEIRSGTQVSGSLNRARRIAHKKHHTATHIVVCAAQKILGDHVWQAGAQKGEKGARIDITHFKRISNAERNAIEMLANKIVMENRDIRTGFMDRNEAEQKYGPCIYQGGVPTGKKIRIVRIGKYNEKDENEDEDVQACAGTHLSRTGECGTIKLLRTERIQDGIERIEYAAGEAAIEAMQRQEELIRNSAAVLNVPSEKLPSVVERFFEEWKQLRKETERLRAEMADLELERLKREAEEISCGSVDVKVKVISAVLRLPVADTKGMMKIASQLSSENFLTILVSVREGEKRSTAVAVASVPASLQNEDGIGIRAGEIIKRVCETLGGSGGGGAEIAQGGGPKIELVDKAREDGLNYVKEKLKGK
ncbi:MAG: alanine--tRNA ligase [Methanophagales archaeon]|nr:alanine--tRNA ligase [Methanophagales archaeon]